MHGNTKIKFTLRSSPAGVDGKIILKWTLKKQEGGVDWIDLAQDTKWRAHVNAIINLRVP